MPARPPNGALSRERLVAPDQAGRSLPTLGLDALWNIRTANAPVHWLFGTSLVHRHLLDIFFDPELTSRRRQDEASAVQATRAFSLATAPSRAPAHAAYVAYTQRIAGLFQRYPAFAVLYQEASTHETSDDRDQAGAPELSIRLEFVGPADVLLPFQLSIEPSAPRPVDDMTDQCVLTPADPPAVVALLLFHLLHGAATPEELGTTGTQHRGWLDALLRTIRDCLTAEQLPASWDPVRHFRAQRATDRGHEETAPAWPDLRTELAALPPAVQQVARGGLASLAERAPQLMRELEIADAPSSRCAPVLWQPGAPFPLATAITTFGQPSEVITSHPVYGSGFCWDVGHRPSPVAVVQLFPERRYATIARVEPRASLPGVELVLDLVGISQTESLGVLQLLAVAGGWAILVTLFTNGEMDIISRLVAADAEPFTVWRRLTTEVGVPPSPPPGTAEPPVPAVEAAAALGFHPTYIKTLIRSGKLTGRKLGRNWFVDPASLAAFREERDARGSSR